MKKKKNSSTRSKIDEMNVGHIVLELRKELTCEEVADVINAKYLPAGVEPLTKVTISRYCTTHGMLDHTRNDISKISGKFDPLQDHDKLRARYERHINKLGRLVDEVKADEERLSEISSVSNAYLNACRHLQKHNEARVDMQAKMLKTERVRVVISLLIDILRRYPEVYATFMKELREHEEYSIMKCL